MKVRSLFAGAYVKPLQDQTRAFLAVSALPALCSSGLQVMAVVYTIAGFDLPTVTLFHMMRLGIVGFLIIPLSFWFLTFRSARLLLSLMQLIGTLLFLAGPHSIVLTSLACGLTSGPFWAFFSQRNATAMSTDNQGNDVAFLSYLQVIAICLGTFLGGLFLKGDFYMQAVLISSVGLWLSTMLYVRKLPSDNRAAKAMAFIHFRRPANKLTLASAVLFSLSDNGLPTWMRIIGLSPLSAGTMLALRPLMGALLTPLAGHLINKGGLGAGQVGGLAAAIGWLIVALAPAHPWLLLPAIAFLTVSVSMIGPMELNRWFKRRAVPAIMAREWLLAFGRCVSFPTIIPVIFAAPALFPFMGVAVGLGFVFGSKKKRRK